VAAALGPVLALALSSAAMLAGCRAREDSMSGGAAPAGDPFYWDNAGGQTSPGSSGPAAPADSAGPDSGAPPAGAAPAAAAGTGLPYPPPSGAVIPEPPTLDYSVDPFRRADGLPEPPRPADAPSPDASWEVYRAHRPIVAGAGERARIPPWKEMGRRVPNAEPFGPGQEVPDGTDIEELPGKLPFAELPSDASRDERIRTRDACRRLVEQDAGNLRALWCLAKALQDLGEAEAALVAYDKLTAAAPGLPEAHLERGVLLSDMFRHDEALISLDRADALEPGWDVHLNRGIALCFGERFRLAEWDLWKAVEAEPEDGNAYWDLAWLYAQVGDAKRAVEMLRFAARDEQLFGGRFWARNVYGDLFLKPIHDDPVFVDYVGRLPPKPFRRQADNPVLDKYLMEHSRGKAR
jgi:hypothetical protein